MIVSGVIVLNIKAVLVLVVLTVVVVFVVVILVAEVVLAVTWSLQRLSWEAQVAVNLCRASF